MITLADGQRVLIAPRQIICWVSLTPAGLKTYPRQARPFPAVLDTGFNHGFLMRPQHISMWSGFRLTTDDFPVMDHLQVYGAQAPLHEADLWLHSNVPGSRDQLSRRRPVRLQMNLGVAVSPDALQPR